MAIVHRRVLELRNTNTILTFTRVLSISEEEEDVESELKGELFVKRGDKNLFVSFFFLFDLYN